LSPAVFVIAVSLLGSLLVSSGCGRKGPPFLPKKSFDVAVMDLRGDWADGYVELRGRISHPEVPRETITGCRVFYADFLPAESPCETCPIEFKGYHGFGPEVIGDQGFYCKVPGKERGRILFFQVRLAGPGDVLGPPTKTVRVDIR
jgi:hypothetical protein